MLRHKDKDKRKHRHATSKSLPPRSDPVAPEPPISNPESNPFAATAKNIFRQKKPKAGGMLYSPSNGNGLLQQYRQPTRHLQHDIYSGNTLSKHHSAVDSASR